jgi:hypothetical protein
MNRTFAKARALALHRNTLRLMTPTELLRVDGGVARSHGRPSDPGNNCTSVSLVAGNSCCSSGDDTDDR